MNHLEMLRKYPIISEQVNATELAVILRELELVLNRDIPGSVVEFGCFVGTTSLFIRRLLDSFKQSDVREFHAYDSFAGLPPKRTEDLSPSGEQFVAGELTATRKQFAENFKRAHLVPPVVHKGWFSDFTSSDIPAPIAFAFLDGDFYDSIIDSLRLVWPQLSSDGTIVIDDYEREALPGVARAVRDFFQDKSVDIHHQASIAIIHKK